LRAGRGRGDRHRRRHRGAVRRLPRVAGGPARTDRRPEERVTMTSDRVDVATLFPTAIVGARRRKWPKRTALAVVVVVAAAVLIGGLVMRASGSSPAYRTVAATQRDIQAMLQGVGTIEPVTQAAVAFPVSGTVAAVNVAKGDTVTAGQALASLDVSSLTAALHQQQAALDPAELTLP